MDKYIHPALHCQHQLVLCFKHEKKHMCFHLTICVYLYHKCMFLFVLIKHENDIVICAPFVYSYNSTWVYIFICISICVCEVVKESIGEGVLLREV